METSEESVQNDGISPKQLATSGFADIIEELLPAVVNISATQEAPAIAITQVVNSDKKKSSSIGSGFFISKDGFIITNSHVIEDSEEIKVNLHDGSKYKAKLIGIDKRSDLALLKIESDKEFKFVKFGDSDKARIGDWVIVIGNPYSLGGSVSVGIVSARSRDINNGQYDELIQTDAAINKGNSGGPMFNSRGEVIGISTAIFSPSGGNVGIGFALPSASAIAIIKQLKDQGEVARGWLGVSVQDVSDDVAQSIHMDKNRGAFVTDVSNDSPADKAGILPTDIIIKFDDQEILDMKTLPKAVARTAIGKTVKITILRQGKIKNLEVKITRSPEETKKSDSFKTENKQIGKSTQFVLGLGLAEFNATVKSNKDSSNIKGLLVVDVTAKSEASEKGVMFGDVILSANQTPVSSIEDLKMIINGAKKNTQKLFLFIKRGSKSYAVGLNIPK